ncbi:MAG: family 16 glycosylhydrolase [Luteibaculum sp.]
MGTKIYLLSFLLGFGHTLWAQSGQFYKEKFTLRFLDEFDQENETRENWITRFPWGRYTSGSHYYKEEGNLFFQDGILEIRSKNEEHTGEVWTWDADGNFKPYDSTFYFTSGMLYHKLPSEEGYFECRFKTSNVSGTNAAFWLYGDEHEEIDVFEIQGSNPEKAQMTLHWKDRDPYSGSRQAASNIYRNNPNFSEAFHRMAVQWNTESLRWYVDGQYIEENFFDRFIRSRHIPGNQLHFILTQEVGTLDKNIDTASYPASFWVDYVSHHSHKGLKAPEFIGQAELRYQPEVAFMVDLNQIEVKDSLNFYPYGHRLILLPGENYELNGDSVFPGNGYADELIIPARITNGIDSSEVFFLSLTPDLGAGVDEKNKALLSVAVYPNPSSGILHLSEPVERIKVLSTLGKIVWEQSGERITEINLESMAKGYYLLLLENKKGRSARISLKLE